MTQTDTTLSHSAHVYTSYTHDAVVSGNLQFISNFDQDKYSTENKLGGTTTSIHSTDHTQDNYDSYYRGLHWLSTWNNQNNILDGSLNAGTWTQTSSTDPNVHGAIFYPGWPYTSSQSDSAVNQNFIVGMASFIQGALDTIQFIIVVSARELIESNATRLVLCHS